MLHFLSYRYLQRFKSKSDLQPHSRSLAIMPFDRPSDFLQGKFVVRRLGLDMINLHTKFETSMFTHYEDIKYRIGVVWGLEVHSIKW